jgi:nucleoside-triphosphatase THEP1
MVESKNLLIYTGPIKSGKSSQLYTLFKDRENTAGILSLVIKNKRHLYSIRKKETKLLEAEETVKETDTIMIGKHEFDKTIFEWGRNILHDDLKFNPELIIIDEIGLLELAGSGLAPVAFEIIEKSLESTQKVVVVVRDTLVKKFLEQIALKESQFEFFSLNSLK